MEVKARTQVALRERLPHGASSELGLFQLDLQRVNRALQRVAPQRLVAIERFLAVCLGVWKANLIDLLRQ